MHQKQNPANFLNKTKIESITTEKVNGVGLGLGVLVGMFLYFFYGTKKGTQIRESRLKEEPENLTKTIEKWRKQIALWQEKLKFSGEKEKPGGKNKPKIEGNKTKKHYFTFKKDKG